MSASLQPSNVTVLGSRSGASLADVIVIPITRVTPTEGETANPDGGLFGFRVSKFKYFAWVLSMAFATPSEPGLLDEDAKIGSPGWVTSFGAPVPSNSTSPTCIQQPLLVETAS